MNMMHRNRNLAARMGRWSAAHWKTAAFGWLAFVLAAFMLGGMVGTTMIDTSEAWRAVWHAISCHKSQLPTYDRLTSLSPDEHRSLWGRQSFYRAFSTVNGGRARETDLFEGCS